MEELFRLIGKVVIENDDANKKIDETTDKAEKSESKFAAVGEKIKSGLAAAAKAGAVAIAGMATVAATGFVALSTQAVQCYADYEQLVGGVETLFGAGGQSIDEYAKSIGVSVYEASDKYQDLMTAQDAVMKHANAAYETAGLSANEYMETVTSFSAALISSLDGDTVKAAEVADKAIVDMSDNANKMGSSMESIQNAYQGFAKQNYTMLDNLKLGYGGTKEEMQRLLDDAGKLANQKFDLSSYADIVEAIHVVQTNMGITGTTAKEAATTIQGSIGTMKAAWTNFLTGMADPDQDFDALLGNLVDSVVTVADNLIPRISALLPRLVTGLSQVAQSLAGYLPEIVQELLPALISGVAALTGELITAIPAILQTALPVVIDAMGNIFDQLGDMVGLDLGGLFDGLVDGASQVGNMLKGIMPGVVSVIQQLIPPLLQITQDIMPVVVSLITVLTPIVTQLLEAISPLIAQFLTELIPPLLQIIQTILPAITSLLEPVISAIQMLSSLLSPIVSIIGLIASQFASLMPSIMDLSEYLLAVLMPGIQSIIPLIQDVVTWVVTFVQENMTTIQSIFQAAFDIIGGIIDFFIALFKGDWEGMWEAVKTILQSAWDYIVNYFTLIKDFLASVGSAIWSVVQNAWENVYMAIYNKIIKIKDTITNVFTLIKNTVSDIFTSMKDAVSNIFEGIWSAIKGTINKILGGIETMVNGVVSGINKLLDGVEAVANAAGELLGFDPVSISLSSVSLPRLAKGAVVTKPTVAEIGEDGAEAIVPLEKNTQWIEQVSAEMQNQGAFGNGSEVIDSLKTIVDILHKLLFHIGELSPEFAGILKEELGEFKFELNNREFARAVRSTLSYR